MFCVNLWLLLMIWHVCRFLGGRSEVDFDQKRADFQDGGPSESGVSIESPFSPPCCGVFRIAIGHFIDNSKKSACFALVGR